MKITITQVAQLAEWFERFQSANGGTEIVRGLADLAKIADGIVCRGLLGRFRQRPSDMTPAQFVRFMGERLPEIMAETDASELVAAVKAFRAESGDTSD